MKVFAKSLIAVLALACACRTPRAHQAGPAHATDAASFAPYAMELGDLKLGAFLIAVDGVPLYRENPLYPGYPLWLGNEAMVTPGERLLLVKIFAVRLGLKNLFKADGAANFAEIPIKARVEPNRKYQFKAEVQEKDFVVWLEDRATGASLSVEKSSAPFRPLIERPQSTADAVADALSRELAEAIVLGVLRAVIR